MCHVLQIPHLRFACLLLENCLAAIIPESVHSRKTNEYKALCGMIQSLLSDTKLDMGADPSIPAVTNLDTLHDLESNKNSMKGESICEDENVCCIDSIECKPSHGRFTMMVLTTQTLVPWTQF